MINTKIRMITPFGNGVLGCANPILDILALVVCRN
jgi:hypothetical protein